MSAAARGLTLAELRRRLYASRRGGVVLELDRVRALMAALGDPQRAYPVAHIGGTNGKGSTAAFVASIARAAGARVGLYTSPHLSRFAERFVVDGVETGDDALLAAGADVERAVESMTDTPTFFERVTAIALVLFARAGVDLAVLEVGLGGRLDATNVVDAEVAAVTGVAIEHTDYLGSTLAEIAAEKAGIFKAGRRAVIGCSGEAEAVPLLRAAAARAGVASVRVVGDDDVAALAGTELGIAGAMQRCNAACALAVVDELEAAGVLVAGAGARRDGLAAARLAGRFETVSTDPIVIVDGAHNPHAARALADTVRAEGLPPVVLVLGLSRDKDAGAVAEPLAPLARAAVATRSRSDRAAAPSAVAETLVAVRGDMPVEQRETAGEAIDRARALAGPDGVVLVAGSLFLAGEAREHAGLAVADDDALTDPL